jgi:transcription elongation GreA/GreB family factor
MSRAFVKEGDDDLSAGELPERPLSAHPNYVTPRGIELLQARVRALEVERDRLKAEDDPMALQKLAEVKRDMRYYRAQLDRAQLVDPAGQPSDEVHFGASVSLRDETGKALVFHIVGDDEADVASGRISWASPLAKAMIGSRIGDIVKWQRPPGITELEVVDIRYDGGATPAPRPA